MPAWRSGEIFVIKLLTVSPENARGELPTIHAQVVVFDGRTGAPIAIIDGTELTRRRTAAASALAATFLASERSRYLVVLGTGPQALHQALAHTEVTPVRRIGVWGRSPEKAKALALAITERMPSLPVHVIEDLEASVREADVISCATSSANPLILGSWLKPGAFLDLVGSHSANRRECDDEAMRRGRIYADTLSGALSEAGDLLIPLQNGTINKKAVLGDLIGLCKGGVQGRGSAEEITIFKSDRLARRLRTTQPLVPYWISTVVKGLLRSLIATKNGRIYSAKGPCQISHSFAAGPSVSRAHLDLPPNLSANVSRPSSMGRLVGVRADSTR